MKKERSKEMQEVVALIDKLKPIFYLQGWMLDIGVHKEPHFDNPSVAAEISPKNQYKTAALRVYPPFFKESKEAKRDILIHELCHIIAGIQNGVLQTARRSIQVSDSEANYAFEEETSWFATVIAGLVDKTKF